MSSFPLRRRADAEQQSVRPLSALIIDDEASFRAHLVSLVEKIGFATDQAVDATAALERISATGYDLMMVNPETAGVSSLDLIARLRSDERMKNTYAILVTAHEDVEKRIAALAAGFDDFLTKSASELEIVAKLVAARRLVARQHTFDRVVRELYGLAIRDELTGVFNRRFFVTETEKMLGEGEQITIVLFDLDNFKTLNDTFGHLTGDRILRDIGALLQRCTRPEDLVARYGGDEFVMVFSGAIAGEVERVIERLVVEIQGLSWTLGGREFRVGVTIGLGSSQYLRHATLLQIVDAADRDLYKNKYEKKHPDPLLSSVTFPVSKSIASKSSAG
jgi:diguanylate cyclase (GGDEF)-like protein